MSDNPFPVSDNFKEIVPTLMIAAVETFAFMGVPVNGRVPADLIVHASTEWALRQTGAGGEDATYATVWELSSLVYRLSHEYNIPLTPFDVTSSCGDPECDVDHAAQTRVVNDFFAAACAAQHQKSVKVFSRYVNQLDPDEWQQGRVEYTAMLLTHVAERVGEYRAGRTEELPPLTLVTDAEGDPEN